MPFRSEAQRRYLWATHPDIARRWTDEYGSAVQPKSGREKVAHELAKHRSRRGSKRRG